MDGAQAVRAGVAAADDHDPLSSAEMMSRRRDVVAGQPPVLLRQVLDGEVHTAELATRNLEVPRPWRPAAEHDRIELPAQAGDRQIDADLDAGPELDAFGRHDGQPSVDEALFELELGNAVAQQTADAVGTLENRDLVAGLVEFVGRGEAGRTRADDRHSLSGSHGRRSRLNPSACRTRARQSTARST